MAANRLLSAVGAVCISCSAVVLAKGGADLDGLDGAVATLSRVSTRIHEACTIGSDKMSCQQAATVEPLMTGGSVGGGAPGGFVGTYVACNIAGFIWSGGTSLLWCGIVGTAAGSYLGAKGGQHGGEKAGDKIYETFVR